MEEESSCFDAVRGMMLNDLPIKPFPDQKEFSIYVSEFVSPNLFYGQLVTEDSIQMLQELTSSLADVYSTHESNVSFTPKLNEICVAKFEDGNWYRASVIQYNSDMTARVYFVDFGNKSDVETQNIRCIKEHLLKFPRMALKFSLSDIESATGEWSDEAINMVKQECTVSTQVVKCIRVNFQVMDCNIELIEEKLIANGFACRRKLAVDFPKEDVFTALIMHVKDVSLFHGQLLTEQNIRELTEMTAEMTQLLHNSSKEVFEPTPDVVCAGFHHEFQEWYRVKVLSFDSQNATVKLLDFGDEITIPKSELRKLSEKFLSISTKGIPMCLYGVQAKHISDHTGCVNKLQEHLYQKKCTVEVVTRTDQLLHVRIVSDNIDTHNLLSGFLQPSIVNTNEGKPPHRVMSKDISKAIVKVGDIGDILVTNADNPKSIHVQLVENIEQISQLDSMAADMTIRFKDIENPYEPIIGEICAAYFANFGQYFRGVVLKVEKDEKMVEVQFIDYGNKANIGFTEIAPLPLKYVGTPQQAVHFSLYDINKTDWSEECIKNLQELILNKIVSFQSVKKSGDDVIVADLTIEGTHVNKQLSNYLVKEQSVLGNPAQPLTRVMQSEINKVIDTVGDIGDILVTNADNPTSIHVQLVANIEQISQLDSMAADMTIRFKDIENPYEPIIGEVCAAYFANFGQYFRGVVLKVEKDEKMVEVQFIDYGNKANIGFTEIAPLPLKYVEIPQQAVHFSLYDINKTDWSEECIKTLQELILNKIVSFQSAKKSDDDVIVADITIEGTHVNKQLSKYLEKAIPRIMQTDLKQAIEKVSETGDVLVTNADNPTSIHVQLVENIEHISQLDNMAADMTTRFKDIKNPYEPIVGEVCAAYFPNFSQYFRGVVLKVEKDERIVEVQFIDYGNKANIGFTEIAPLPLKYVETPQQAVHFSLYDTNKTDWSEECIKNLQELILNKIVSFQSAKKSGDVIVADLTIEGMHVNKQLSNYLVKEQSVFGNPAQPLTRVMRSEIKKVIDTVGDIGDILVTNADNPTSIHVQLVENIEQISQLDSMAADMTTRFKDIKNPYEPIIGEVCAAYFANFGQYFRGVVLKVEKDERMVEVQFIDYGNKANIGFTEIAPLPLEYVETPQQAVHFSLYDTNKIDWSEECIKNLQEFILNKIVSFQSAKKIGDDVIVADLTIEGTHVNKQLSNYLERDFLKEPSTPKSNSVAPLTTDGNNNPPSDSIETEKNEKKMDRYTKQEALEFPSECDISVQHIESTNLFYGQINTQENFSIISQLTQEINDYCNSISSPYTPNFEELCCGLFEGIWCRCVVVEKFDDESDSAKVFFIDFGNSCKLSYSQLRKISNNFIQKPSFAFPMRLTIEPSEARTTKFQEIALNQVFEVKVVSRESDVIDVELFDRQTGDNIVDVLSLESTFSAPAAVTSNSDAPPVALETPAPPVATETPTSSVAMETPASTRTLPPQRLLACDIPESVVPDNGQLFPVHVDGPAYIYAQLIVENYKQIEQLDNISIELTSKFKDTKETYKPIIGEACVAFFPAYNQYFRCEVIKTGINDVMIRSLDFGNTATVTFSDIAPLPMNLSSLPKQAVLFRLNGVGDDGRNNELLQQLILNQIMKYVVKGKQDGAIIADITRKVDDGVELDVATKLKEDLLRNDSKTPAKEVSLKPSASIAPLQSVVEPTELPVEALSLQDQRETTIVNGNAPSNSSFTVSSLPSNVHPLESVVMKMDVRNLSSGTFDLCVTYASSPFLFYGKFNDRQSNSQLESMSNDMTSFFSALENPSEQNLKAGALIAVHDQGIWKRGIISKIGQDFCNVFLIDSGMKIQCRRCQLHPLPKQFKVIPAQAIPMKLITVKPVDDQVEWPEDVCKFLGEFITGQSVRVRPEFKDGILFGVRVKVQNKALDNLLEEAGYAVKVELQLPEIKTPGNKDRSKAIPFSDICKIVDVEKPVGDEFEGYVTCVISPRLFYCRLLDDEKDQKVDEIARCLKAQFDGCNDSSHEFSDGDLCSVKLSDDNWYRGFILKVYINDSVTVWLIDYGSKYQVTKSCIHQLPEIFRELPAQSITAQMQFLTPVEDNENYTKEACERFRKLLVERVLNIRIVKTHDTILRVLVFDKKTGTDVGDKFVAEGYAKYIYDKKPQYLQQKQPKSNNDQIIYHHNKPATNRYVHPRPQMDPDPYENDPYGNDSNYDNNYYMTHNKNFDKSPTRGRTSSRGRGLVARVTRGRGLGRGQFKYPPHGMQNGSESSRGRSPTNGYVKYSPDRTQRPYHQQSPYESFNRPRHYGRPNYQWDEENARQPNFPPAFAPSQGFARGRGQTRGPLRGRGYTRGHFY